MSKINFSFNGTDYSVDESYMSSATSSLKSHLSTVMSGSGATINLGGTSYNVDSAKLSAATNEFISHLGTIAGNGNKVVVGGVEYSVDSTKVSGAISELEAAFSNFGDATIEEDILEGDGQTFYIFAPTTLSFRSTAPLNEFQEVKVDGVAIDSSNYTLTEGSTIVTLSTDYLKTLDAAEHEIIVVSDNGSPSGTFSVIQHELNEYGFYYNQPYSTYMSAVSADCAVIFFEDGTADFIIAKPGDIETENDSWSITDGVLVYNWSFCPINFTISSDGYEIACSELGATFTLSDSTLVADEEYVYVYNDDLSGYEVKPIKKNKSSYSPIRTGVNGVITIALSDHFLEHNENITNAPKIPDGVIYINACAFNGCSNLSTITIPQSVVSIGDLAFDGCEKLTNITFNGTMEQWNSITKGNGWNGDVQATYVQCSDGTVEL